MKKPITIVLVLIAVGAGAAAYYMRDTRPEPTVSTMPVIRGDVVDLVQATGTLEAVTTVDVGTQVSGLVQDMYVDFNHIVKKGQIIARLDPSLIETQIQQRRASVIRAEADLERLRVNLADSRRKLEQARAMWDKQLIPRDQLETAEMNVKTLESQIKSADAGLTQAEADLNTQQVNLGHTVIRAPIDGIVILRNVDPGQTVAASMNAPLLYQIAADLTKMQVLANIDESDVGRIRPGQQVGFRVDAYPTDRFTGTVEQVRLQPTVVQNVVVYSTVISAPNPELKLKPGMTANVEVEIARRNNVLRVPAAATRFRPTEEMFLVLNQDMPPEAARGGRGMVPGGAARGGRGNDVEGPAASGSEREARGGGDRAEGGRSGRGGFDPNMTPDERRRRMEERLASMTPAERARARERMQQAGRGGQDRQGTGARDLSRGIAGSVQAGSAVTSGATTIDALFAPLPVVESRGRVWLHIDRQLKPINVRLGISDGTFTELITGDLQEGQEVVVNMVTGIEARPNPNQGQSGNPLMGPQRGGRGRGR